MSDKAGERIRKRLEDYDQAVELSEGGEAGTRIREALAKGKSGYSLDGTTYLGEPFLMKEDDPDEKRPQLRPVPYAKVFDLSDEAQLAEYNDVLRRAKFGKCAIIEMDRRYDRSKSNFVIYVNWQDHYVVNPDMADDMYKVIAEAEAKLAEEPKPGVKDERQK